MSEHLPECYWPELPERAVCICDRLRACEQRVRLQVELTHEREWIEARDGGYAAGLDAAEAAVAGMVIETVGNSAATVEQAITVIHALKVQP